MEIIIFFVMFLFFFIAIVGGIIFIVIKSVKKKGERIEGFQSLASQWGFNYVGEVNYQSIPHAKHFHLFNQGSNNDYEKRVKYLMTGTAGGFRASVFEYWYVVGGNRAVKVGGGVSIGLGKPREGITKRQTVVMLESPNLNLPVFSMSPESQGVFQKVGEMFGGQDIDFQSNPVFSGKYLLRGANEQHLRHVFNPPTLSYFESSPVFSVEGGGNQIFIYNFNVRVPMEQMQSMVDAAIKTATQLANN